MAQMRTFTWTNANPAVARNQDVGFTVAEITTVDTTNGGSWYWNNQMAAASSLDVDSGTISGSNGFTALAQSGTFGTAISAFTAANPGVMTVTDTVAAGFAAGDTVKVTGIADDQTGVTLNADYTIASLTATTITTATNTTALSAYVSDGTVTRVSDTNGNVIPTENVAIRGITIGTTPVGAASAVMVAVVYGEESVT